MILSNPITVKELRSRMRGIRAILPMMAYLVVLSIFVLSRFAGLDSEIVYSEMEHKGRELGFWLLYAQMFLVLLLSPAYAASAITVEKERETFEVMQATLLTSWDIVAGKIFSGVSYAVLLVLCSLPLLSLSFWMGGFDWDHLIWGFLIIATSALVVSTLGILLSTLFSRSYIATGVTYGTILAGVGGSLIFWTILKTVYHSQGTGAEIHWHTLLFWLAFTLNPFFMLSTLSYEGVGFYAGVSLTNPIIDGLADFLEPLGIPYVAVHVILSLAVAFGFLYLASFFLYRKSRGDTK